jgi:hypothetical protein
MGTSAEKSWQPQAIIRVRFKTTAEGGRKGPIDYGPRRFRCPLFIDGEAFDCGFLVKDKVFELGETYEIPIAFFRPDLVLPMLSPGKPIKLWEGKDIAVGIVVRLGP